MIVSRVIRLANVVNKSSRGIQSSLSNVPIRHSHGGRAAYRSLVTATDKELRRAEAAGAFFWAWVFYHLINDYEMLIGEYYSPKPALWTDEELGIPPDDAGLYVPK